MPRRAACRGLSMVELLVACALALGVCAATGALVAGQLRESRSLLLVTRMEQELRAALDLVARDLRRSGHWGNAGLGVAGSGGAVAAANPYGGGAPSSGEAVRFSFSRDAVENNHVDDNEQFAFRLRSGALQMQLGAANWQTVTDIDSVVVTAFTVTPRIERSTLADYCEAPCPAGSTTCPPYQQVTSFAVALTARSAVDTRIVRALQAGVRVRNDAVLGSCV